MTVGYKRKRPCGFVSVECLCEKTMQISARTMPKVYAITTANSISTITFIHLDLKREECNFCAPSYQNTYLFILVEYLIIIISA